MLPAIRVALALLLACAACATSPGAPAGEGEPDRYRCVLARDGDPTPPARTVGDLLRPTEGEPTLSLFLVAQDRPSSSAPLGRLLVHRGSDGVSRVIAQLERVADDDAFAAGLEHPGAGVDWGAPLPVLAGVGADGTLWRLSCALVGR